MPVPFDVRPTSTKIKSAQANKGKHDAASGRARQYMDYRLGLSSPQETSPFKLHQ
ncbi:hypothetical protein M406DRAFT_102345 [Cryphonectria parasitica EP155]|uniref:Uncharacterized protein n=1 Tax=Cryphonectria parasitica (strain ATCC 38755 / EP155) TaxID=660469 RepID=A0A9P4Y242_CRYP1|nr:uncharacterized protein M406DRAFT_102345 [Cryphonectria parasitica EP155]KAF3765068.1 hypothetical protein M406DRAFT_102345 [Cryphonectria parasitica EP155]